MKTVLTKSRIVGIRIKRNVSVFPPLSYLPFQLLLTCLYFFYFIFAFTDFKAFRSCEIKVHMAVLAQS